MVDGNKIRYSKKLAPKIYRNALEKFGEYILVTNFKNYVEKFSERFSVEIHGEGRAMQAATNSNGLTIINFGMGSPNAATIMDLLVAVKPKGVLFLGKCGGLKDSSEIGNFILPIGAIRGDGTSNDYFPLEVPALPSFKLHKFVSDIIVEKQSDYRTGVIFTTNRRVWEHDKRFLERLKQTTSIGVDMETATIFSVGHFNEIARGALLLVSDVPLTLDGVKTEESDKAVTQEWVDLHLEIGIKAMTEIGKSGEEIKHFKY